MQIFYYDYLTLILILTLKIETLSTLADTRLIIINYYRELKLYLIQLKQSRL